MTEVIWYLQTFFLLSAFLSTVILGSIMAVVIIAMMLNPDDSDQWKKLCVIRVIWYHMDYDVDLGGSVEVDG